MISVLITGGSGFLANHLIRHLQENSQDLVSEIRTVDRKPFHRFLEYPDNISISHYRCELSDVHRLEKLLENVQVVFHLARKPLEYRFKVDQNALNEQYIQDNLNATKCLMQAMTVAQVPNLVYVGDAYANLPPSDNFGTSEVIHSGVPRSYLLGEYGATRTQAELHARSYNGHCFENGKTLNCVFLRPTFVYGEGDRRLAEAFHAIALNNNDCIPHFEGSSNGLHQYIYAGNLARLTDSAMRCLLDDPQRCAGEFFYCMDDLRCTKFAQFFEPIIKTFGYHMNISLPPNHLLKSTTSTNNCNTKNASTQNDNVVVGQSYHLAYAKALTREFIARQLWRIGMSNDREMLSTFALRLFHGFAIGFSDRKQKLMFSGTNTEKYLLSSTEIRKAIASNLARTAKWARENITHLKISSKAHKNRNSLTNIYEERKHLSTVKEEVDDNDISQLRKDKTTGSANCLQQNLSSGRILRMG